MFRKRETTSEEASNLGSLPTLSVCICAQGGDLDLDIVSRDIRRAIESVKGIADEIVILEAKSADEPQAPLTPGTLTLGSVLTELSKEFQATFSTCVFDDDLSKLWNAAIRMAQSDFIMILDPDEEVDPDAVDKLTKLFSAKHYNLFYTKVLNYDANGDVVSYYYRPRIFRRDAGFYFAGEFLPEIPAELLIKSKPRYTNINLKHYGYALPKEKQRRKIFRNLRLFKKQSDREPQNPYCYFYAAEGSELVSDFGVANEYLVRTVEIIKSRVGDEPKLKDLLVECYFALTRIALSIDDVDSAIEYGLKGYDVTKNNANINFILGEAYFEKRDFESAYKHYKSYVEIRDMLDIVEIKGAFMVFDSKYYVNFMLGKSAAAIGKVDDAFKFFEKALELKPQYADALNEIGCIYQLKENNEKAKDYFEKAILIDPSLAPAVCNLGVATFHSSPKEGLELMKNAHVMQPGDARINDIYNNYKVNEKKILEERRLAVCIIAYDHSRMKETIKSTMGLADEFILLDEDEEGSRQKDIKGKRVLFVNPKMNKKIAEKRNRFIERTDCDWLFMLHEGEYVEDDDLTKLAELTASKDIDQYFIKICSAENQYHYEPRLFRKRDSVEFDSVIFDKINNAPRAAFEDICIHNDIESNNADVFNKINEVALADELALSKSNYYANFKLGKLYFLAKEWGRAVSKFELARAGEMHDDNGGEGFQLENLYLLGASYLYLNDLDKAKSAFLSLLQKEKNYPDAFMELGYLNFKKNEDPVEGIKYINGYFTLLDNIGKLKVRPLHTFHTINSRHKAYCTLGNLYKRMGELDKAVDAFNRSIDADPNFISSYLGLSKTLIDKNDFQKAKWYVHEALKIDDNNIFAHQELAVILMQEQKFDFAKDHLAKCLEIDEDNIETFQLLGLIHEATGSLDKAEQCYRAIVDRQPHQKNYILKLGDVLIKKEDFSKALNLFKDLLKMSPDFVPANVGIGKVLMLSGKLDEAAAHFADLRQKSPDVPDYILHSAKVALAKKNFGDAVTYLDQLAALNSKYAKYVSEQKQMLKDKGII